MFRKTETEFPEAARAFIYHPNDNSELMNIRIVTDSTCDLPPAVVRQLGISVLPVYLHIDGRSYLDGVDITAEDFYRQLNSLPAWPTTAVPSTQKFADLYASIAAQGAQEILSIHASASLTAICKVAQAAAGEAAAAVRVYDSGQVSLGLGFLAESAARLAQAGRSLAEIAAALDQLAGRTRVCAMMDTLEYVRRSGRVSGLASSIGDALHIKPILKLHQGELSIERVRTRKNAFRRMQDLLNQSGPLEKIAFLHTGAVEQAQALMHAAQDLLPGGEVWLQAATPVLGTHLGPGAVGFACVSKSWRG